MDKPVYRRTASRRESFRIDIDFDEVRKALCIALDEDIPDTAAFHITDVGDATFCWDIDYDVDGPSIEPVEPDKPTQNGTEYEGPSQGPGDPVIAVKPGEDPVEDLINEWSNTASRPIIEPAEPGPIAKTPYEQNLERHRKTAARAEKQCVFTFCEGATRKFRCHLDHGHEGDCGPAEGCEPEDPPKGRRRSW